MLASIGVDWFNRRFLMSRVQLARNVTDIDKAVESHSKLFATEPVTCESGCF